MRRPGLVRFPLVTAVALGVAAAGCVAQALTPGLLAALERAPAGLHGQWWRLVTALVVQDGGAFGAVSNLLFLALVGTVAEQLLSRPWWVVLYAGTGVLAELVGSVWQPVGAGNSIAVCGLTGGVAVALWRGRGDRAPVWAVPVVLIWCGALAATVAPAATGPAIAAGAVLMVLASAARRRGIAVDRPTAVIVLVTGVGLAVVANIHGAALLIGVLLGLAVPRSSMGGPVSPIARPGAVVE